jgi:hypothetical protein
MLLVDLSNSLAVDFFHKFILDMRRFLVKMFFHDIVISDLRAQIDHWEECCVSFSHHGEREEADPCMKT